MTSARFIQRIRRHSKMSVGAALLILSLAGCGQKGPLYLPDEDDKKKKKADAVEHIEPRLT